MPLDLMQGVESRITSQLAWRMDMILPLRDCLPGCSSAEGRDPVSTKGRNWRKLWRLLGPCAGVAIGIQKNQFDKELGQLAVQLWLVVMSKAWNRLIVVFLFLFGLLVSSASFSAEGDSSSLRDILPYYSVEKENVKDFAKAIIHIYLFYGELDTSGTDVPNFLFVSGENYLENGKPNPGKIRQIFPGMSDEEIALLKGESDLCLVFEIEISGSVITIGINDTEGKAAELNYKCFLDAFVYFFDKENKEKYKKESYKEYSRNIIKELNSKFAE